MTPARFTATVVTFHPDPPLFARAMGSLAVAIARAREAAAISEARVFIVDNGDASSAEVARTGASLVDVPAVRVEVSGGHGNIGYGRANNLVLAKLDSDFHLV